MFEERLRRYDLRITELAAVVKQFHNWSKSSNPSWTSPQSLGIRTSRRMVRNPGVCARFAIMHGPGERPRRAESAESSKAYPGAIWLGPWIIAVNSPAGRTRRTGPMKADCNSRGARRQLDVARRISSLSRSFPGRRESRPADSYADRSVCCCRPPACSRRRKLREAASGRGPSCRPDIRRRS